MIDKRGSYIVLEGMDGCGSTTQKNLLEKHLKMTGEDTFSTREPGGSVFGEVIREILLHRVDLPRSPETNFDLFTLNRRENAIQDIAPALGNGKNVLSDRNWFSSIAYQGFGEGLSLEYIKQRSAQAMGKLLFPDCAVIIDVPVEIGISRIKADTKRPADYFESKDSDFFNRVRQGYLWIAKNYNIPVVDGCRTIEKVQNEVRFILAKTIAIAQLTSGKTKQ